MMMAVSFERYGRLYYLDPGAHKPAIGDKVLVPTDSGPEVAECVWAPQWVSEEIDGLPVCAGIATDDVHPDALLGALYQPFVSLAVGLILFEAGLRLSVRDIGRDVRRTVGLLVTVGVLVGSAVDCRDLTFGKWDTVRAAIDRSLQLARQCRGVILATGNHLPANIPAPMLEQYRAYLQEHRNR